MKSWQWVKRKPWELIHAIPDLLRWVFAVVYLPGWVALVIFAFHDSVEAGVKSLAAFGTVSVVLLTAFRDWIHFTFFSPKLTLEQCQPNLTRVSRNRHVKMWVWNLKVSPRIRWRRAENCRACIVGIERIEPDSNIVPEPIGIPQPLKWGDISAPEDKVEANVGPRHQFVNFFSLRRNAHNGVVKAEPYLVRRTLSFHHSLNARERAIYTVEISAENMRPMQQRYEVIWHGEWTEDRDEIGNILQIRALAGNS